MRFQKNAFIISYLRGFKEMSKKMSSFLPNELMKVPKNQKGREVKNFTAFNSSFLSVDQIDEVSFLEQKLQQKKSQCKKDTNSDLIELIEIEEGEFDIFSLHETIKNKIKDKNEQVPDFHERLERYEWIRDNTDDVIEKKDAMELIFQLKKDIKKFSNDHQLNEYENLTRSIIEEYKKLLSTRTYSNFMNTGKSDSSKAIKKQELQNQFFQVASKYVKIKPLKSKKKAMACSNCGSKTFEMDDDDTFYCGTCHTCYDVLEVCPAFKDKERINMSKRFRYSCERHFSEAFEKVQGKQNTTIPDDIIMKVNDFIKQNDNITKKNLQISHILLVLHMYGYTDKYEDVYLIHSMVTGIPPRDISKYKDVVMNDYRKQQEIASQIKVNSVRKNSLNVYYVLCRLLQKNGYNCKLQDFYCLKTDETKEEHDDVWKRRCEKLGWEVILD